ncbi:MAG TPA: hypothetical protein VMY87_09720 [Armatimonadota bacterium]|nr:hypothetical protein [Armatimonadota bacterium]
MKRHWLTGMVAVLVLAICVPAHAIVLRFRPKVGSVQRHKASMAGRMESSMEGMGNTMRAEMTIEMDYSEKVVSQTDEATRLEAELLGGKAEITFNQQTQTMDMPTAKMVADLDARGRVVKLIEADMPDAKVSDQLLGKGAESFPNWSQFSAFPEGDVSEGDAWSDTISIPVAPDGPELELTFESKLLALTTFQSRECAKIRTSFSAPVEVDLAEFNEEAEDEGAGAMTATLQGDILWYYDHENSVYVYGEGTIGMDMKMSVEMPNIPGGTMATKMVMNLKTTLAQ